MTEEAGSVNFKVDEVLEMKGWLFKIVLVDPFTNKICMKRISTKEAEDLKAKARRQPD
ncbi:MAG: hypothetical protein ACREH5_01620 [Candidatus Omnitrophota bacterium]